MENNTKKIKINYNMGKLLSTNTFKLALGVFLSNLLLILIFLVFGTLLIFDNIIFAVLINLAFLSLCFYFYISNGISKGEKQAAKSEIAFTAQVENKNFEGLNECYHPLKGLLAVIIGMAPMLFVAIVFSIIAKKIEYQLPSLPQWLNPYLIQTDMGLPLQFYSEKTVLGLEGILRIIVRTMCLPYVSMISPLGNTGLYFVDKLSPILILIVPSGFALGYYFGKSYRVNVNNTIKNNRIRKNILNKKSKEKNKEAKRLV